MKNRQPVQSVSKNKLFTWMMIGTVFILIDLAILFYFLSPETAAPDRTQSSALSSMEQDGTAVQSTAADKNTQK